MPSLGGSQSCLVWDGILGSGSFGLELRFCHRAGWGMGNGGDQGILEQDWWCLLRGQKRHPVSPTGHCPLGMMGREVDLASYLSL